LDKRLEALTAWLDRVLGTARYDLRPASADASFRRYFRVTAGATSLIAMDAPPEREDVGRYVRIARAFEGLGLHVPAIHEEDAERGFLLISDLGDRLYLPALTEATVERLYGDALGALLVLQTGTYSGALDLPPYDEPLLRRELEIFREWYLGRHLGLGVGQRTLYDRTCDILVRAALEQPRVWVHRDYHSRNLMVTDRNNPGILDFQDAVLGPVTYDLVSLLRDCYIAWPRARVEEWVSGYYELGRQSGVPVGDDDVRFLRWFDLMGVQRHLKAIGIFARLHHRDGKPGYLADIPRTLRYVTEAAGRREELEPLRALLAEAGVAGSVQ
jgi:aminoglycoside/choline kinase family phosphotransferase